MSARTTCSKRLIAARVAGQQYSHGVLLGANYTWSHAMGSILNETDQAVRARPLCKAVAKKRPKAEAIASTPGAKS